MKRKEALDEVPHMTGTVDGTIDLINDIFDDHEAEVKGIVTVLKKLDEFPPIEKDKAINELIDILEDAK